MKISKYKTAEEALKIIKSGDRIFVHGSAATPLHLIQKLVERADELQNIEITGISTLGNTPYADPKYKNSFHINSLFVSANVRKAVNDMQGSYIPIFLSEIPQLFLNNILPLDIALIHVSPPDQHGYCSLGISADAAIAATACARHIIAQVNPKMPRVFGDGLLHVSKLNALVEVNDDLPEVSYADRITKVEKKIGEYVAEIIDDGATLQMGIGGIPDAVLQCLGNHKNLGVHSEMFSDGILPLVKSGVINNKLKKQHTNRMIATFIMGTRKLYDFIDNNPSVHTYDVAYVNDTAVIRSNPKVTAINSAIEIDITGQVCADSIGTYQFSGVGGQMDFIRGAALSEGGKPIIALPSTTRKGISRIVPFLNQGAGVVTTRAHMRYVVTEYGVVNLFGKNLRQRAKALIEIAHPEHRENLDKQAYVRFKSLK